MCRLMNPCMTTWPAYVPTLDEDSPDASSATAKASAAPPPTRRPRSACAAWSEPPRDTAPPRRNRAAATNSMARLISPAAPSATTTSIRWKRISWRRSASSLHDTRPLVRAECRYTTCGITVAPMMPATSSRTPWPPVRVRAQPGRDVRPARADRDQVVGEAEQDQAEQPGDGELEAAVAA